MKRVSLLDPERPIPLACVRAAKGLAAATLVGASATLAQGCFTTGTPGVDDPDAGPVFDGGIHLYDAGADGAVYDAGIAPPDAGVDGAVFDGGIVPADAD